MTQNIYDNQDFFAGYAKLSRSVDGLEGAPEWSAIRKILPPLSGRKVVDLGCGYGWFCRYARSQGAADILGLDVSEKMLNRAKELTPDDDIIYRQEDLEKLHLPQELYHLAYSSLTLHYIKELPTLFATVYNALLPGGSFVFTAEHPIYTAPKQPGWLIADNGQKSWPLNSYQAEGERVTNWLADGVIKQHRTLGTYINLLVKQGFVITTLDEWGPTAQQIADNPALDEEKERPMLFLLSAKKPE
ncbi:class I SAM-dependent methyltransferase [Yersinia mollaretii]|uniref:Methyl transferase n=1 Tax=Yersinia mollaretii (strain ATCC 43969 / DSM 18520 / CIP 103324 / CNY 7263 / WAIP 204) TaxID=349967 RepID=A0ABP2E8W2_YERMW|nr:class I SAM-dependent methyltransferase [Yersinia mollaretii]EEQ08892.1 Methyl transferase [Yersinia mollaretii ATCC 43969]MDN0110797.1 class I SAM-dependent methyltransferase [Yersinia mollaretii]PJE88686.1 class I SAM-dependent methyltransferase [Yersinia mollaretii]QKJ03999.1 class I SAM-dependent methyltransferase [Yersinia mollaretii ATCC 43969]CQD32478.1 biotin synthesis protein bioC [Yersinia mollaretii]